MSVEEKNLNAKSAEAAKAAMSYPPAVQYAIAVVAQNVINGAFWGFTDVAGAKEHADKLVGNPNMSARKLSNNDCLIEVNPDYLLKAIVNIDPNLFTKQDLIDVRKSLAESQLQLEKFLIRKGKEARGFSGLVGVYCTNDVSSIRYKNVEYPAFRVNMQQFLAACAKFGYRVKVGGQFVTPQAASQSGKALWESMILSPTKTGVFIEIASTYTVEQMKKIEADYKAQYAKK